MSKLKTKKSASKRFKLTASGKVKSYQLDQAENFYTVEVELFNDMTSLDHVYIIDNKDKTQIENLLNNSNDQ